MSYQLDDQITLRKLPTGPLSPWLSGYVRNLHNQKHANITIHRHVRQIVKFSEWLAKRQVETSQLSPSHFEEYLQIVSGGRYVEAYASLKHLKDLLVAEAVVNTDRFTPALTAVQCCTEEYRSYLSNRRNLAEMTIAQYAHFVRSFLHYRFESTQVDLVQINIQDIHAFIRHEMERLNSSRSMRHLCNSLRSFLRYAHAHYEGMPQLAEHVPAVMHWKLTSLPCAITPKQIESLLLSIDRTTLLGRRDYAIVLLLARLGLRAGEIVKLTLDDINWRAASLTVSLKGSRRTCPLTAEIGEAIADYLQNARPPSQYRQVFLRGIAPICGFACSSAISSVIHRRLAKGGIDAPSRGSHQFRHGLATEMLRHGASLHEIGDLFGHRHCDTTRIYAKVDVDQLRTLALPWPGGAA